MTQACPSVVIVADDPVVSSGLATALSRLGFPISPALSLEAGHARVLETGLMPSAVTIIGVASASDTDLWLVRGIAERSVGRPLIVSLTLEAEEASRVRRELSALVPVVDAEDDRALRAATDNARQMVVSHALHQRSVWELQVLSGAAEALARSLQSDEILRAALDHLQRAFDAGGGAVHLHNERTGEYEVAAVGGFLTPCARAGAPGDAPATSAVRAIASRGPIIADALVGSARGGQPAAGSVVTVPMIVNDGLLGTLTLIAAVPRRFDPDDARVLGRIADAVGLALHHARLHESARRSTREWEHTFDAISDPMAVFDADGALLRGNSALAAVLGGPIAGRAPRPCHDVGFCGGAFPRCAVGDAALRGAASRAEITLPDGQIFSVTTFPVSRGDGPSAVVQVAQNVTEEIRSARRVRRMSDDLGAANARLKATVQQLESTQANLLQAEKLSALGQLVAGVAHELNNPLTSVIGYAQLLEDELLDTGWVKPRRLTSEVAQDLRRIVDEAERAARIVRNLLAFARRQSAARAPQDIVELLTRVLSLRAYELRLNAIELRTVCEPHLPPLVADGGQIQQALLNLILNAEQAMRGATTRRLTVAARFDPACSAIELSITDTGHGMDVSSLTRIFDPFFTTRGVGDGAGLGLSICYGVVRDHGGQIAVESTIDVGSTFTVLLPVSTGDSAVPHGDPLLVAHSDPGERDFISAALVAWGYTVASTTDADEALTAYRAGALQTAVVDRGILATDLAGWSAARAADRRRIPVVLVARAAEESDIDRFGREQGCVVLTPPFQLRALRSAIRTVVKECV